MVRVIVKLRLAYREVGWTMGKFFMFCKWFLLVVVVYIIGYLSFVVICTGCQTVNGIGKDLQTVTSPYVERVNR